MGNFFGNFTSGSGDISFGILTPDQKRFDTFPNALRKDLSELTGFDSAGRSSSFHIQEPSTSFLSTISSWFRLSKRKQRRNPNYLKTTWPVPNFESIFLPEFKIRDDVTENSFHIVGTISSGAFGKVLKVIKYDSKDVYAMKILSKAQMVANNLINQVKEEVKIQQLVGHHPFIVDCSFYWQSRKQLYIISEYISGGDLSKLLQEKGSLPQEVVRLYAAELAVTLDFLHNAGIIFRDLKLENILLNSRGHIQLIDFGLSKWLKFGSRTNTICGTLQYIAPEVLQKKSYGHAVDWWSLGIVVVCLINGQRLTGLLHSVRLGALLEVGSRDGVKAGFLGELGITPSSRTHYIGLQYAEALEDADCPRWKSDRGMSFRRPYAHCAHDVVTRKPLQSKGRKWKPNPEKIALKDNDDNDVDDDDISHC